jgi:hypothetical protein
MGNYVAQLFSWVFNFTASSVKWSGGSFSDPAISSDSDSDWIPKFGLGLKKSWLSYMHLDPKFKLKSNFLDNSFWKIENFFFVVRLDVEKTHINQKVEIFKKSYIPMPDHCANTLSPSPKGFQSPKFSDSDFREVRGLGLRLGRPKISDNNHAFYSF